MDSLAVCFNFPIFLNRQKICGVLVRMGEFTLFVTVHCQVTTKLFHPPIVEDVLSSQ